MQAVPSPSRAHFDFPPSISTLFLALPRWLPGLKSANNILGYLSFVLSDLASLFTLFHFFILSFFFLPFFLDIFQLVCFSLLEVLKVLLQPNINSSFSLYFKTM